MSQQESQQMNDGHSETIEGELTPLWSSRLTACVCVRAHVNYSGQSVTGTSKSACFEKYTLACPIDSDICAEKFPSLIWFCLSRKKKKQLERKKRNFWEMEGVWLAYDSSRVWLRCRISAVSESPCSSDRERDRGEGEGRQREGEENKGSWEDERKMVAVPLLSFHLWLAGVCQRSIWSSSFVDAFLAIIMWCKDHTQAVVHTSDHTHASV